MMGLWTAFGVVRRSVGTRGRFLVAAGIGAVILLLAVVVQVQDAGRGDLAGVLITAGLTFQVPVVTLVFAASAFGDFTEDETLVYLWLRPVPRWHLAVAATFATFAVTVPVTALPLAAAALVGGAADLLVPVILASVLATGAYGALFVALGLRAKRALTWGLLYVLIWEGLLSNVAASFARVSLRRYVVAIFTESSDIRWGSFGTDTWHAVTVLLAVTVAGMALCTWYLRTREID